MIEGVGIGEEGYIGPGTVIEEDLFKKTAGVGMGEDGYIGPPGQQDQLNQQIERIKSSLASADDPDGEFEKVVVADYIGQRLGKPTDHVYRNLDAYAEQYFTSAVPNKTTARAVLDEFKRAKLSLDLSKKGLDMMMSPFEDEVYSEYEKLLSQMPSEDTGDRNFFEQSLKAGSSIIPSMGTIVANGLTTGGVFATIGGIAGTALAGPAGSSAGAKLGFGIGARIGSAKESYSLSAGGLFADAMMTKIPGTDKKLYQYIREEGQDPEQILDIARSTAIGGGVISASIEALLPSVGKMSGFSTEALETIGDRAFKAILKEGVASNVLSKAILKYGINIAEETLQEVSQEIAEMGARELTKNLLNKAEDLNIPMATQEEWINVINETAKQTAMGMGVIGGMGASVQAYRTGAQAINEKKAMQPKGFRTSEISTASPISNVEMTAEPTKEEYQIARRQYEASRDGDETIGPIKVTKREDGTLKALDNAMLKVAIEENDQAIEIEIIDEPQQNTPGVTSEKPDWTRTSQDFNEWKKGLNQKEAEFKAVQALEDFEYNVKTAFPDMSTDERSATIAMVEARAAVQGMEVSEYIQNTFAPKVFTTEKIDGADYKAAAEFKESGKALIHLTEQSDFSSWVHEYSHVIRKELPEADLQVLQNHYNDQSWSRDTEELFVKDFEDYLYTGKAPSSGLKSLFQRIASGLKKVYDRIGRVVDETRKIPVEVQEVFNRIFTPQGTVQADINHEIHQISQNIDSNFNFVAQPSEEGNSHAKETDNSIIKQPTKDLSELYTLTEQALPELDSYTEHLAEKFGGRVLQRPINKETGKRLKSLDRAERKLDDKEGSSYTYDLAGSTVIYKDIKSLRKAVSEIQSDPRTVRIKDRYAKPLEYGYRDVLVNIRAENGAIVEIQLNTEQMIEAKKSLGHTFYEVQEQIQKAVTDGKIGKKDGEAVYIAAGEASKKLYSAAFQALKREASFSASSLDITEALWPISAILTPAGAGARVLSGKTWNKLKGPLEAIGRSSQSKNFKPSDLVVNGSDIDDSSSNSIHPEKIRDNGDDLPDLLFQDIELFEDLDGVMYNKHEEGVDYESREIREQYRAATEELEIIEGLSVHSPSEGSDRGTIRDTSRSPVLNQWKRQKRVELSGHTLTSHKSLAELFSVFRNPLNEYFHIIYVDDDNKLLAHNALTSGVPGRAMAFDSRNREKSSHRLKNRMERLGASGYYLMHNHPTGNVEASGPDIGVTRYYRDNVPGLKGHVILNHTKYAFFDENLIPQEHDYAPRVKYDARHISDIVISNPEKIADYAKSVMPDDTRNLLLYLDSKNRIIFAEPVKDLNHNTAYQKMRGMNAAHLAFATESIDLYNNLLKVDVQRHNSQSVEDVFLDILHIDPRFKGIPVYKSARDERGKPGPGWQDFKAVKSKTGFVWENEVLYQDSEHEEIIRKAIDEFKPVPQDVLNEYSDRDWAHKEIERRQTMEKYSWLVEMAIGIESPELFKEFILDMGTTDEIAAARELGESGEDRFYHEIWSRANLKTREEMNKEIIKRYATKSGVVSLAAEVAANPKEWMGSGIPGPIWILGNSFHGNKHNEDRLIQNAITSVKNNPLQLRQALADQSGDEHMIRQLQYEEEIEYATPQEIKIGRLSTEERLKEASKTDDPKIRKMYLSGAGTDSDSLLEYDKQVYRRIGTLKAQNTKRVEQLQKKLGLSTAQVYSLENSKNNFEQTLKELKAQNEKEVLRAIYDTKDEIRQKLRQQRDVKNIKERMRMLSKNILRKPAENCHWSFKEEIYRLQEELDGRFRRSKTAESLRKRREFYEQNPELKKLIDPELLKIINQKPLNEWTLVEIENLNNKINKLREKGALKQAEIEADRKQKTLERAAAFALEIGNGNITTIPRYATNTDEYQDWKKSTKKDKAMLMSLRPSRILKDLAGEDSQLVKFFWDEANKHTDESIRMKNERMKPVLDKMKALNITAQELSQKIYVRNSEDPGQTVNDVIHMYIVQKNEKNMRAVIYGVGIKNPGKFINLLTEEQRAFGDAMAEDFAKNRHRYAEAYAIDKNDTLGMVQYYFPMRRQTMLDERRSEEAMRDLGSSAGVMDAYANRSGTHSRIDIGDEHQAPIRMGAFDLWAEEVERQEHYIASSRYIKDMHSVLKNQTLQAALVEKHGHGMIKWLEKYINEFANPNLYKFYDSISDVSRILRNNMALGYLAFNTLTIAKQAPSLALFMGRVGPHRLAAAAGKFITNPIKYLDFVNQRDPQMKERSMERVMEELKLEGEHPVGKAIHSVAQIGMKPISMVDKIATTIGWLAVYDSNILKGEDIAIQKAQEAVLETQPAARAKDLDYK